MQWFACSLEQAGEQMVFPTNAVVDAWQQFGASARARPPFSWFFDGSTYIFSFVDALHSAIPTGYVAGGDVCTILAPNVLPNGHGGTTTVGGASLCDNGRISGTDAGFSSGLSAYDGDGQTIIEICLIVAIGFGLVGMAWSLLRKGGN
jgi:hypothetical protein